MATKTKVCEEYLGEYLQADKKRKSEILAHACFVTRMHRKAAIRKFGKLQVRGLGRNGGAAASSTPPMPLPHFAAVRRTAGKERIGSRDRRTCEKKPQTPYQRILAHPAELPRR